VTPLLKLIGSKPMMWFAGTMGDSCCTMGLLTAVTDKRIKGVNSQTWFSLAFVGYLYFIMSILSRIVEEIDKNVPA
jgi:hypothetical protein